MRHASLGVLAAGVMLAHPSWADTTVDIAPYATNTLTNPNTGTYPAIGAITIGGVNFSTTTQGKGIAVTGGAGASSTTIPVDITDPSIVYTVINSGGGRAGFNSGSIIFGTAGGKSFTYELIEGSNVRDHYAGSYINTTTSPDVIGTYNSGGGERLDAQEITLPMSFGRDTLTSITFNDFGGGVSNGEPFLAALTIGTAPVPETATWAMMIGGLGLIGGVIRNCRRNAGLRTA